MDSHWQHAWQWLCCCRQNAPTGADIWHLRFRAGEYGAVVCPGCLGPEVGESTAERKAVTLPRCTHTAGHRGAKWTAGNLHPPQGGIPFYVPEQHLRQVIHQYIDYCVEEGGGVLHLAFRDTPGCALSPLLGASFLWYVDGGFEHERGLFYVRYMDDFLFLSQRRWPVRRAITRLH